jgi:hypothetical protein
MAKAIPAMSGEVNKEEDKKDQPAVEKALIELPKPKEKITLPDGTVIESY